MPAKTALTTEAMLHVASGQISIRQAKAKYGIGWRRVVRIRKGEEAPEQTLEEYISFALREAKAEVEQARADAEQARADAEQARADAEQARADLAELEKNRRRRGFWRSPPDPPSGPPNQGSARPLG